ncbi:hypothetical protein RIF29_18551 [Crotalaria pallida]|uniref:peroxidase n=1 Tax=Crotalaria pallida TaxID=3830 RepID=A0AAN9FK23_CROPI
MLDLVNHLIYILHTFCLFPVTSVRKAFVLRLLPAFVAMASRSARHRHFVFLPLPLVTTASHVTHVTSSYPSSSSRFTSSSSSSPLCYVTSRVRSERLNIGNQKMSRISAYPTLSSFYCSLLFISFLLLASHFHVSEAQAKGLSPTFFDKTCPQLETIVRNQLRKVFKQDNGQAPGLLRILFHDCFVQGCDGSILLDGNPGERNQGANIGIRTEALNTIDTLRALVHKECGPIVSCADITVLAARDAVTLSGGPDFKVVLGRRDSTKFSIDGTGNLPGPGGDTDFILARFGPRGFDATDVVALSGAHTFGRAHCSTAFSRIVDPTMDQTLANNLKATCPTASSPNTVNLDARTPIRFDNQYYIDILNRQGVFNTDQDLVNSDKTKGIVNAFAKDQNLFFQKFANAIIKLSQLDVLTGNQGEIRAKCNAVNKKKPSILGSVVEEVVATS